MRFVVNHVPGDWVLRGVSFTIPPNACVGVIGNKGSGKSTLLRIIAGLEQPTSGKVVRNARIAMPMTYSHSLQPLLSGRQNAKFICRINGFADELEERLKHIESLSGLGEKFDMAISTYTPVMKTSLSFALSMAFDFDTYLSDGFNFSGEAGYKSGDNADVELKKLSERAGMIMVVKGAKEFETLRRYCKSGIWLHEGKAEWFDDIDDAIEIHKAHQPIKVANIAGSLQQLPVNEEIQPLIIKMKQFNRAFRALQLGLRGTPSTVSERESRWMTQVASQIGMQLMTLDQIRKLGYQVKNDLTPVLLKKEMADEMQSVGLYDLGTQCTRVENT